MQATELQHEYDETPPGRDRTMRFTVEVDFDTAQRNGVWRDEWGVTIKHPDGEEEQGVFKTDTSAELFIGDRILAMAAAIVRANR